MIHHIDFETFSAAGFHWDPVASKWRPPEGAKTAGLPTIGAELYAMHPSTRVICLAWGDQLWRAGDPPPLELWRHVESGRKLAAWNSQFEWWIWRHCLPGWPRLPLNQIVDGMPRARAFSLPGGLGKAAEIVLADQKKDTAGWSLIRKFCMPRAPTKNNPSLVTRVEDDPEAAEAFYEYCRQDVVVETALHNALPPLSDVEHEVWQLDQEVNVRGIPVDSGAVHDAAEILRQADRILNAELRTITAGEVEAHSQIAKLGAWVASMGVEMSSMDADSVKATLDRPDIPSSVRRALEIRAALSSTSTKKIWAFRNRMTKDSRIHGQFTYCGADRTGRWSGRGIQPHNFPRGEDGWTPEKTERFIADMVGREYGLLASRYGDVMKSMASSLRGLICAREGHDLIGSDYSAIEAVVLAVLAGEQWRIDVFNGHGKIYESSASKITGMSLEEYAAYKEEHGKHHSDRQLGKVAELASGYGGSIGAWKNFGAERFFTPERCEKYRDAWLRRGEFDQKHSLQDFAILQQVRAWREASPAVATMWKCLEASALAAVRVPGEVFRHGFITYQVRGGVLYCKLPSGRELAYHEPRIGLGKFGRPVLFYHGNNTNPKFGGVGWVELNTYGGKLAENVVQAVSRDLLAWGMLNVKRAGYSIVMHVHDEIICEEPEGCGSVAELERLMMNLPDWAKGWPVKADGGWRGKRFRK